MIPYGRAQSVACYALTPSLFFILPQSYRYRGDKIPGDASYDPGTGSAGPQTADTDGLLPPPSGYVA